MNFSALSTGTLAGRLLRLPLRLIRPNMRLPILQGPLKGKRWVVGSGAHGYWLGSFELNKRLAFQRAVSLGAIVFDVGANVGYYTLLASILVGETGKVLAFEPLPRNLRYLEEHLTLNRITNLEVFAAAVSVDCGRARFEEGLNSSMGALGDAGALEVDTVAIDDLISSGRASPSAVIKIDVEGGEMRVLMGGRKTLESARPILFLATHLADLHRDCCEYLRALGYLLFSLDHRSVETTDEVIAIPALR
jgi:FkbM family methyltransferase